MDYWAYINRKLAREHGPEPEQEPTEQQVRPSEPIEVTEFDGASTTIVRRLRRYWTDKRS